jgi:hypothetical protein
MFAEAALAVDDEEGDVGVVGLQAAVFGDFGVARRVDGAGDGLDDDVGAAVVGCGVSEDLCEVLAE